MEFPFRTNDARVSEARTKSVIEAAEWERSPSASSLDEISVLILAYNEGENIGRTLERLKWAQKVVLVDSLSTDDTRQIATEHPGVTVFQRSFDNHASQWNYGLAQVKTEWVLSLDADYQVTEEFASELAAWSPDESVAAYYVRFKYCIGGHHLRGTLYPPRAVLFRRTQCRYEQDGHTQVLRIDGDSRWLKSFIYHDDRKPLSRWLTAQDLYARLEAQHLLNTSVGELNLPDRLRRWIVPAPLLVFLYTLLVKGLIFDGWPGLYYVFQRTLAETLLSLRLIELGFQKVRLK